MGGDGIVAEMAGEVIGDALGEAAGIGKDERSAVFFDEFDEFQIELVPDFVAHNGFDYLVDILFFELHELLY